MNAWGSLPGLPAARFCLFVALAAAVLLGGGAILRPSAVAMGWLVGFAFWSSLPIGAVALALIHETTGGRWGLAAAPTLRLLCLLALLVPLFFIVLAFSVTLIYPWARDGASIAPEVGRLMLNAPLYAVYGLVALLGWVAIALLLAAGRLGLLGASLSLAFHGLAVSVVSVAWLLSVDPRFTDSGFGAEIAVQQILFALAAVAVLSPARAIALAKGDIAALLLASALGAFYLSLMTFIVKWYGDQPDDVAWYLARAHGQPFALLLGALVFGAAAPILACAWERVRTSPRAIRLLGLCTMLGIFLHDLWLVNATIFAVLAALASLAVMVGVSLGFAPLLDQPFGMWLFLMSEILFFGALFMAFSFSRAFSPAAFAEGARHTEIAYGAANTVVLVTSSLTITLAVRAADIGRARLAAIFLAATAALGLLFLVIKGFEYRDDFRHHLFPGAGSALGQNAAQIFWAFYWAMTGIHAIHLAIGIALVLRLFWLARRRRISAKSPQFEVTSLYWHLVDAFWLVLFPVLYVAARG